MATLGGRHLSNNCNRPSGEHGEVLIGTDDYGDNMSPANVARMIACVNACTGISSETLEGAPRLLAAAYNAFDSAAKVLGCNAVELAERMADSGIADLIQAVRAAKEMSDWFMKHSRQAEHAFEELKQPLHETDGWKELVDSGYNGLMASYGSQFEQVLAKVKGGAG